MDIKTLESFSLGDAIFFHDDLNKNLWDMNNELRPEVKKQLIVIAKDFIEELGIKDLDVKDITVSGSNAAYTYTKHSDLDLHILVDMDKLPENEVYRELFTAKKNLYNDSHDIKVHGVPVELYVQDSNEPVVSLGEYSLLKDKWLRIPTKRRANFDQTITKQKYKKLLDIIEKALKTKDLEKVNNIITTIKRYRKAGLDRGGEFGPENLAYKALRTQGYIDKLYNLRDKLHSIDLSIEEQYKVNPIEPTVPIQKTVTYPKQDVYIGGTKRLAPRPDVTFDIGNNKDTKNLVYTMPIQSEIEENIYFNNPNQLIDLYLRKVDSKNLGSITLTKILQGLPYGNLDKTLDLIFKKYSIKPTDIVWQPSDKTNEDYDPNGPPPGPEFKPTMPKGTVRVDVSDVYDWYKLGQHISNMQGLGKHDFGKGPPSTIMAFGDEDLEHQYIQALKKTGLSTTDIDPASHKKIKGQKVDPTFNVNEVFNTKPGKKNNAYWEHEGEDGSTLHFETSNGIEYRLDIIPMWMGADEARPWEFADTTDEQEELGRYVEFSQNDPDNWMGGKKDVTGTGSSAEIFGIVVNGILQYVKKFKPPFLMMQAAEMNRRRLYNAMLTRLLPLMPGYKSIGPKADGMYFIYDSRVIKPKVSEEEKPKQGAKSAIYSTDVYGMTAYHSKCLEPGCDWESKRYDSIKLAQNAAQKHAQKHFKKGVAEGLEQITEYRHRLLQYVKRLLPTWPEYVLKDWLVPNKGDFSNLPHTALKDSIMEKLKGVGLTPNSKWQLIPNMKFTMDMFDPMTKQRLIGRAGGSSDMGLGVPKDKERHATQAQLAQQQGGVRKEPVLLIKTANGYELLEGWHRTIQHFAKYPDGYTGPAYVAVAQSQQGVVEGRENYNGLNLLLQKDDDEVFVKASAGGKELGHVLFVIDGEYLMPQDLEVEERYRGQGIAKTMYDFVKSKGYKIRRSGQQTDAGAGFWAKHRPEQNVWEQGAEEEVTESRNSLFSWLKQQFPTWPDYVVKDFLYQGAKLITSQEQLADFLEMIKKDFGKVKWRLEKLPITLDIFTPKTQQMIKSREGGSSNPFKVPKDAERHAQQLKMIQQHGVRTEPIIVAKLNNGYDLIEGWHRTIQHLKAFPEGYTGPAWVGYGATYTSEIADQGVAESASGYIPSNAEKDDPRFKTALTVDIKPDTMKKDAKKFGNKISRAGIPPTLSPSGKF